MITDIRMGARALITTVACSLFAMSALAEPAATTAPAAAPAAKAAPAASAAKPAATTAAAPAKAVVKKAAVSVCKGLDENGCKTNAACGWIMPKDANDKTGKVQPAYCRKVAGVAAKKPAAPAAAKAAAAPAAAKAPAAPATAAAKPAPQVTTTTGATAKAPAPAQ
jgi:hypothetical protein